MICLVVYFEKSVEIGISSLIDDIINHVTSRGIPSTFTMFLLVLWDVRPLYLVCTMYQNDMQFYLESAEILTTKVLKWRDSLQGHVTFGRENMCGPRSLWRGVPGPFWGMGVSGTMSFRGGRYPWFQVP